MKFKNLPKIELHVHLDCSLSYETIKRLRPQTTIDDYNTNYIAGKSCTSLKQYIKCADNAISLMQSKESLELVMEDFFNQLIQDNVIYCEIRFAPLLHTDEGLNSREVVNILCNSMNFLSKESGIFTGLILCTLRHYSKEESMETVKLVEEFKEKGVIGFDIAADEAGYPLDNHIDAFNYAKQNNINCTAHAGEAKGPESIWETIDKLKVKRIGHGVKCIKDPKLVKFLYENNFHLEVCVSSNIKTKTFNKIEDHPISQINESSISMSINTDGRTISSTDLTNEYEIISKKFGWSIEDFRKSNLEAIKHAFASDELKTILADRINKEY
ncbi:MAG: adenosine deaminase [Flavobacteriaceae bacterium]|nr:adenosine deaminase [Flavobacteriaceae bacterium]